MRQEKAPIGASLSSDFNIDEEVGQERCSAENWNYYLWRNHGERQRSIVEVKRVNILLGQILYSHKWNFKIGKIECVSTHQFSCFLIVMKIKLIFYFIGLNMLLTLDVKNCHRPVWFILTCNACWQGSSQVPRMIPLIHPAKKNDQRARARTLGSPTSSRRIIPHFFFP